MFPRPPARIYVAVQSHAADPQFVAELRHRRVAIRHRRLREAYLGFGQRELPAALAAPGPRGLQSRHRALADKLALELRQRREDAEHQAAARCGRVDLCPLTAPEAPSS